MYLGLSGYYEGNIQLSISPIFYVRLVAMIIVIIM